ncbi:hypothetical protein [Nocardioides sp. Iso805N]|uniref:hypothetical protein n=1 Tax=Nocardioides sp. Iso805N TaxID=1283287 RepID=UPI00037206B6|nr:hypothetical protein [Nocardioides sp. Iso805N]
MGFKSWRPPTHLVHAMFALAGLSGMAISYDYAQHLDGQACGHANPLEQYLDIDLDAALAEFLSA